MKICTHCKRKLPANNDYFIKHKGFMDNLDPRCKECAAKYRRINKERRKEYYRCKDGMLLSIYDRQKRSSNGRSHDQPTYTLNELKKWFWVQDSANEMYDNWENSGYDHDLKPSVDRKDNHIGYTLDNIQIMTWKENKLKR